MFHGVYVVWKKEMLIWAKNPLFALVRSLVFPLLWIIIFGFAFGGDIERVPVAIVQDDFSPLAGDYVSALQKEGVLQITTTTNYAMAVKLFKEKKVYAILYLPPGFGEGLKKGRVVEVLFSLDETSPQISGAAFTHITTATGGFSEDIRINGVSNLNLNKNTLYGRGIEYLDFLAPGVIMMTIVFSAMFSGGLGLVVDREFGTLRMLMAAPISKASIIIGKTSAGVTQSLFSGIFALLVAVLIGVNVKAGLVGALLMVLLMLIAAFGFIGMSIAIGTKIRKIEHLMLSMQLVIIPMWFLSGGLYPLESMPSWMKPLAIVNPLTYATDTMRSVMLRGVVWEALFLDIAIMIVFAVSMLILGSLSFKRTIE
ncbi:MAG: ABC transporter permease [Candidatus Hydrothermarchaeota archaeon]|nr:ABC transporter permease [Candidatus Hydrothermarchaeota archaeon]MDP6612622.1 ABC transporter permease [Candidatus Hydrothermarchaeota archaeon]